MLGCWIDDQRSPDTRNNVQYYNKYLEDFLYFHAFSRCVSHLLTMQKQWCHFRSLHMFFRQIDTYFFLCQKVFIKQDGFRFAYLSLASPPKPGSEIGLTGGATLSGTGSVGSSRVISVNTLSTAG